MLATSETKVPLTKPGTYLWEVPGKPFAIYISLDVVDRLLQDVLRGFGAVPKRGAEVGGILIGRTTKGDRLTVEIEDFELVPIEYKRGPSYLLSDADVKAFEEIHGRLASAAATDPRPVGMFRSHTRDTVGLAPEDNALIDRFFPSPEMVILLIKPFATKVSMAGFYFRENGAFPEGPPLGEFPFRRKELGGGEPAPPPPPRPKAPPAPAVAPAPQPLPPAPQPLAQAAHGPQLVGHELTPFRPAERTFRPAPTEEIDETDLGPKGRSGWVWLPLSFIFLLLGVLLGFQAALTLRPQSAGGDPFTVGLSVSKEGENLNIRWDRQSAAIRAARTGVLVIDDGAVSKPVDLTANQLQTGSVVVYRPNSTNVKFRLELTLKDRDSLFEKLEWKE